MAVDDLFDGKGVAERPDPMPRLRRWLLLASALVILGPCCCTSPFGGGAAIFVWMRAGDEEARAQVGIGGPGLGADARRVRQVAFGLMSASLLTLCLQAFGWPWIEDAVVGFAGKLAEALG